MHIQNGSQAKTTRGDGYSATCANTLMQACGDSWKGNFGHGGADIWNFYFFQTKKSDNYLVLKVYPCYTF